jgi:hypothetical protein
VPYRVELIFLFVRRLESKALNEPASKNYSPNRKRKRSACINDQRIWTRTCRGPLPLLPPVRTVRARSAACASRRVLGISSAACFGVPLGLACATPVACTSQVLVCPLGGTPHPHCPLGTGGTSYWPLGAPTPTRRSAGLDPSVLLVPLF